MLNVFKEFEYLWYTYACIALYETIYLTLKYLPVITLCMPVDNFVVCQKPFANSLNPDEDQQNVGLDLDPNCLTL